jgi:pimeloyl-ACP methyl ester carboxylesterase
MTRTFALFVVAIVTVVPAVPAAAAEPRSASCHLAGFETPVRCVEVDVPLDYADPDGGSIAIAAAVVPATTARPAPDPLFVFAGGPGQAGTDFGPWLATAFEPARRTRDIVLVDFRGTGRSGALACKLPDSLARDYTSAVRQAIRDCVRDHGPGLELYTHREVVEDIERLRVALGFGKINLWGGSFGTRIAQHYVRKYGAHLRSAVLDGATPVGQSIFVTAPRTAEDALARLLADCADHAACARNYPMLADELAELLVRAEAGAVAAELRRPDTGRAGHVALDRDDVVALVRGALYVELTRSLLPLAVTEAARGRLEPLIALGAATGEWSTSTMAFGFTLGIVCSEDLAQSARGDAAELSAGFVRDSYYRGFELFCSEWPTTPLPAEMLTPIASDVPALVISGEADPVTPPSLGEATLTQFTTGVHAVVPGGFHTNSGNPCVAAIIAAFLADPSTGGRDHACLARTGPPPSFFIAATAEGA